MSIDYSRWTTEAFGVSIPQPGVIFAASFTADSPWGQKCHEALLRVEIEYVGTLLETIKAMNVPGALVEFGIFEGAWITTLFELSVPVGLDRPIIGFDSFQGLSKPHPEYDVDFWKEGQYAASIETVSRNVKADERPRIQLVPGFFAESLVRQPATNLESIAFARVDCDIYEPALECLRYLAPRLSHGAVLVFDDWPHRIDVGEGRAFYEWIPTVPNLRFEFLFFGTWGHFYMRVWHQDKDQNSTTR